MKNKNQVITVSHSPDVVARRNNLKTAGKYAAGIGALGLLAYGVANFVSSASEKSDGVIDTKQELFSSPNIWDSYDSEDNTVVYKDKNGQEVVVPVGVVSIGQDGETLFAIAGTAVEQGAVEDQETVKNEFGDQNGDKSLVHDGDSFIYEAKP